MEYQLSENILKTDRRRALNFSSCLMRWLPSLYSYLYSKFHIMNIKANALITEAIYLLEKVEGNEEEIANIQSCIRQLNAIANLSIIKQSSNNA